MQFDQLELDREKEIHLAGRRLLIFVVAYNAETTIEKVLSRIPATLHTPDVEVLIIDDFSKDAKRYAEAPSCALNCSAAWPSVFV